ncbi:MAG: toxic anion resistance protein [Lachnospiraceae bacterium]|nr:toxic anion resistance protein [Lachnospiraceae bacterium]
MADQNELKAEEQAMPTLTFGDAPAFEAVSAQEENYELKLDVSDEVLSDAEKQAVDQFAKQIDLKNTKGIMEYGSGVQKKMADFSQSTLDTVRTRDLGEVGDLLTNVVMEVKNFDEDTDQKGLKGLFKRGRNRVESMKARYDKTEVNINKIVESLEGHQVTLLKDVAVLDKMYDMNMASFKELTMYILAGKKKLEEVRNGELKELQQKAAETGKAEDAQAAKDLADQCNRFEKKLYDLELTRTISVQTAPQIRLLQNTDTQMAEKIQSVIVNTIPLWKNQMVIALGIQHSTEAIKAESAVTNATNELLKKNAESLHMASVESAKANERGIVDLETLKTTNQKLIQTLDDVMKIQKEGREQRAQAEGELRRMEDELKAKLLEMSQN